MSQRVVGLVVFCLLTSSVTFAQLPTATILGSVKDSSGGVVPGATVTAHHVDTGQLRTTVADGEGSYRLPALPVGNYELRVELPGFRTVVRTGLRLTVSQEAVINVTLEVGAVEQAISVTAEAPLINTTTGSLGGLVDEERIQDLPLNGRNYIDLALLQPGVAQHTSKSTGMPGTTFSSNGAPIRSNNYLLDGASMVTLYGATSSSFSGTTLGIEGIQEFRVVTNSFSAEYGMTMGSQTVLVSKSGTNAFHGSLFEYHRDDALDARNFFDSAQKPQFTRNNFGGSFGGPIRADKTHFFVVYEGLRERLGRTIIANVLPPSAKLDGGLVPQISPVIKPFLAYYPDPNVPGNRHSFTTQQPTDDNYTQFRLDQNFSSAEQMFFRYTVDTAEQILPGSLPIPEFRTIQTTRNQYATFSENHVFSPALLNTIRVSFSSTNLSRPASSGFNSSQFSFVPGLPTGNMTIGGLAPWGGSSFAPSAFKQTILAWSDDLFYTRGRHALKLGALVNQYEQYILNSGNVRGTVNFANAQSFLLGQPSVYNVVTPGSRLDKTYNFSTLGFYVQDDLRLYPRLTLNLGLRYEFLTTIHEAENLTANLRDVRKDAAPTLGPPFKNPSLRNVSPRLGFAWDVRGDGRTAIRGGFARLYDLANYGGGLLQALCSPPACNSSSVANPAVFALPLVVPPGSAGNVLKGFAWDFQQPTMYQFHVTLERQLPWDMATSVAYGGSRGRHLIQTTEGNPTVPQILPDGRKFWTGTEPRINPNWGTYELRVTTGQSWYDSLQIGVIKRLSDGLQFQSAYTLANAVDHGSNQQGSDSNTASNFLVDPDDLDRDKGPAAFDARHNWRFNAIYRLPESARADAVGGLMSGWALSGILSLRTGLPLTPGVNTNRSRSGVAGGGAIPGSSNIDRPDLVPGVDPRDITRGASRGCGGIPAGTPVETVTRWYDPCAFTLQPIGTLGNAGRNIIRGPGLANLDVSLTKDTALRAIGPNGRIEFRAEIFNLLNRVNLDMPNRTVFSGTSPDPLPTAGQITTTATTSRQIQLALRVSF
jgi:outer membrane receptor protein involved in Fe transport